MLRRMGLVLAVCAWTLGTVSMPSIASAQTGDAAAAQTAFDEGQALMKQRRYAEACAKFQSSHRIDPRPGTALNLADCYEQNGQLASAWARYVEASEMAARENQRERERYAREHAKALLPKLAKLSVKSNGLPSGAVVKRDGVVIDMAMLGSAVPVDAGEHTVDVEIDGRPVWSTSVKVTPATSAEVQVPDKNDPLWATAAPPPSPAKTAERPAPATPAEPAPPPPQGKTWSTQRTLAVVAAGVGAVGLGAGTFFALSASSKWSDAKDGCQPNGCPRDSVDKGDDARSQANVATAAFIVGGLALAGAGVLWFTAPSSERGAGVGVVPMGDVRSGTAGLMAHGRF
ncbi:tetratricopeptide repeat protein [Pendulispora brunnea]|uniref:Tetratricopeptide repeat protein n=1 Tax=Pendulispora brunnea TaxID=2905690 RepID=A0ABZ2KM03_9BACT